MPNASSPGGGSLPPGWYQATNGAPSQLAAANKAQLAQFIMGHPTMLSLAEQHFGIDPRITMGGNKAPLYSKLMSDQIGKFFLSRGGVRVSAPKPVSTYRPPARTGTGGGRTPPPVGKPIPKPPPTKASRSFGGFGHIGGGTAPVMGKFGLIKPNQYAQNLTKMQYSPLLHQIAQQIAMDQAQGAQNVADINKWYGDAGTLASGGTAADSAAATGAVNAQNAANQAIIGALGGGANPAAGEVGAFGALMSGNLQGLGLNQHGFDTTQQTLVGQEGAQAATNQSNLNAQALQALQQQQTQALSQRGLALKQNLADAQNLRLQQAAGLQAMKLSGLQGMQNLQLGAQKIQQGNLQLKQLQQSLGAHGLLNKGAQVLNDPTSRTTLANQLTQTIMAPAKAGGTWLLPNHAWITLVQGAKASTGLNPRTSRQVFDYLRSIYQQYVQQYENAHPSNHTNWLTDTGTPFSRAQWQKAGITWKF